MRRPRAPVGRLKPARDVSSATANLLLCDVLGRLAEQVVLLPFGVRPVVQVFGVRYALGGVYSYTLGEGGLWPVEASAVSWSGLPIVDGRGEPVLVCRAGRLYSAAGQDLGSAFEEVAFALPGAHGRFPGPHGLPDRARPVGRIKPAARRSRAPVSAHGRST